MTLRSFPTHGCKHKETLGSNSEGTGLKINVDKMKVFRLNARIKTNGTDVEDTDSFVYLGATVNKLGGAEQDIRSRLGKARSVFHWLSKVWRTGVFCRETKMRIFKSNIIAVLLYGYETWRMTKADEKRLGTFLHKCQWWNSEKIGNWKDQHTGTMWIGHVLHMAPNRNPHMSFSWAPSGKRSRGQPRETWQRTVEKEHSELGLTSWAATATPEEGTKG